jgi:hypothetical protein
MLIAVGVAYHRDARVPIALGAFATASFWMTGRETVGNPLLSVAVLVLADNGVSAGAVLHTIAAAAAGTFLGAAAGSVLIPRARESMASLLFVPERRSLGSDGYPALH